MRNPGAGGSERDYMFYIYMQVPIEATGSPEVGVTVSRESPEVGAENQTWVLCKNSKSSLTLSTEHSAQSRLLR